MYTVYCILEWLPAANTISHQIASFVQVVLAASGCVIVVCICGCKLDMVLKIYPTEGLPVWNGHDRRLLFKDEDETAR